MARVVCYLGESNVEVVVIEQDCWTMERLMELIPWFNFSTIIISDVMKYKN